MANYNIIKNAVQQVIKTNGNNEITGALLQSTLLSIINSLGGGYQYQGIATPITNPGTPDARLFYFAFVNGIYPNFSGLAINNEIAMFYYDGSWHKSTLDVATNDSLRSAIASIQPIVIQGDVTNAPDEVDITTNSQNLLQFKNRTTTNGMGYVILRSGGTIAPQMTQANTIYEIRYIFDLAGGTLNIPTGSVLKFNGGQIKNGNVVFLNTTIDALNTDVVFLNVEISGSLIGANRYSHWFSYSNQQHDDWGMIDILFKQSGNVFLESRNFNVNKLLHSGEVIQLCDDINVIGCDGCSFSCNYTSLNNYDTLFDITSKKNITFKDIAFNAVTGATMPAPAGHSGSYQSSGIYAFGLYNDCSNFQLINVEFNNIGYAIKTSIHSGYTGMVYFEDIKISNCVFLCDVPIQGGNFANLLVQNCRIRSRGTNTGNHAVYVSPITNDLYTKNSSLYFKDCYMYSPSGDGHVTQIYVSNDVGIAEPKNVFFDNCEIISGHSNSSATIIDSKSFRCILQGCTISASVAGNITPAGMIIAYNCKFKNVTLYRNIEAYNCGFVTTQLIIGDDTYPVGDKPVILEGCNINVSNSVIFNNTDNLVPQIRNCKIISTGDCIISQRRAQIVPIELIGCDISAPRRFAYCPSKSTINTISFINCHLTSVDASYAFVANSDNIQFNVVNCSFNGDTLNMPTIPRNSGVTSHRPTYGLSVGQVYFDTTLGLPIWYNGTGWVKATGENV